MKDLNEPDKTNPRQYRKNPEMKKWEQKTFYLLTFALMGDPGSASPAGAGIRGPLNRRNQPAPFWSGQGQPRLVGKPPISENPSPAPSGGRANLVAGSHRVREISGSGKGHRVPVRHWYAKWPAKNPHALQAAATTPTAKSHPHPGCCEKVPEPRENPVPALNAQKA